jgi:hypothetical protein
VNALIAIARMFVPTNVLKAIDGYKSIIGLAGSLLYGISYITDYYGVTHLHIPVSVLVTTGSVLGIGLVHKAQKVITALTEIIAGINDLKDAINDDSDIAPDEQPAPVSTTKEEK